MMIIEMLENNIVIDGKVQEKTRGFCGGFNLTTPQFIKEDFVKIVNNSGRTIELSREQDNLIVNVRLGKEESAEVSKGKILKINRRV